MKKLATLGLVALMGCASVPKHMGEDTYEKETVDHNVYSFTARSNGPVTISHWDDDNDGEWDRVKYRWTHDSSQAIAHNPQQIRVEATYARDGTLLREMVSGEYYKLAIRNKNGSYFVQTASEVKDGRMVSFIDFNGDQETDICAFEVLLKGRSLPVSFTSQGFNGHPDAYHDSVGVLKENGIEEKCPKNRNLHPNVIHRFRYYEPEALDRWSPNSK